MLSVGYAVCGSDKSRVGHSHSDRDVVIYIYIYIYMNNCWAPNKLKAMIFLSTYHLERVPWFWVAMQ